MENRVVLSCGGGKNTPSVTFGDSSLSKGAFWRYGKVSLFALASPLGRGGCECNEQTEGVSSDENFKNKMELLHIIPCSSSIFLFSIYQLFFSFELSCWCLRSSTILANHSTIAGS